MEGSRMTTTPNMDSLLKAALELEAILKPIPMIIQEGITPDKLTELLIRAADLLDFGDTISLETAAVLKELGVVHCRVVVKRG